LLNRNQGVVVLTGPTGSGKTTTLYASLLYVQKTRGQSVNIVTLEDPIEYEFPAFSQTQIDPAAGLTFAAGLRAVLRQDPDVIMLGEIRDEETATNAMRAAMTGHLIFTTVHADSAAGVVSRLVQVGIDPIQLSSALCAIISQRLCQTLCAHCREPAPLAETQRRQLQILGLPEPPSGPFFVSRGCEHCLHKGFVGRTALFEMLIVNRSLRDLVAEGKPAHQIHQAAVREGMITLLEDGLGKARRGEVSLDDVLRTVSA
jgi:general secretion pathway protein E